MRLGLTPLQCYDLLLSEGTNTISLHAVDPAGNSYTTNFNVVLDYAAATNPAIELTWPQNDMKLCGDSFTLRGWTEDATAKVCAVVNETNVVTGLVERTGKLWVENLPLNAGTNYITLLVTNAAGHSSETNFHVIKNDLQLALTSVEGDLWLPTVSVNGTISDTNAPVWVNGIQGTNNGDGTWRADNVPVTEGGVASFDVSTLPPGAPDPAISANVVKDDKLILASAKWNSGDYILTGAEIHEAERHRVKGGFEWGKGGTVHEVWESLDTNQQASFTTTQDLVLSSNGSVIVSAHLADSLGRDETVTNAGPYAIASEIGAISWSSPNWMQGGDKDSEIKMKFLLGGLAQAGAKVVVSGAAIANELWPTNQDVPADQIAVDDIGQQDTNRWVCKTVPEGSEPKVTSQTGAPYYEHGVSPTAWRLMHQTHCPALTDTNRSRLNLGVCEDVHLSGMPDNTTWSVSAGTLSTNFGSTVVFTAPETEANPATVTATVPNSATETVDFKVFKPNTPIIDNDGPVTSYTNYLGLDFLCVIHIQPDNVYFGNVGLGEGFTNCVVTGYFSYETNSHPEGSFDVPLNDPTSGKGYFLTLDHVSHGTRGPTYTNGTSTWHIPCFYQTPNNHLYHYATVDQITTLSVTSSSATLTLEKGNAKGSVSTGL